MRQELRPTAASDDRLAHALETRADAPSETIDLGRVAGAARRHWRRIALGTAAGVALAVVYVRLAVPRYQATATVRIDARQSTLPTIYTEGSTQDEVFTEIEVMRSRTIAAEVVEALSLDVEMRQPARVARSDIFRSLQLTTIGDTGTIRLLQRKEGGYLVEGTTTRVTPGVPATVRGVQFTLTPRASAPGIIELRVRDRDEAITALRRDVDIGRAGLQASIIALRYESRDPGLARDVLNNWTASFIRRRQSNQRAEATSAATFIQAQLDTLMPQLLQAEDRLLAYRDRKRIVAPELEAGTQVTRRAELLAERTALDAERGSLQQAVSRVERAAASATPDEPSPYRELLGFPTLLRNQAASELLRSLASLDDQRTTLLIRRTERDPDVVTIASQIRVVEKQLQGLTTTYLRGLTAQVAATDVGLAGYDARLRAIPAQEVELARLERAPRVYDELVGLLQTRLKEAQITEAVSDASVRVVDAAVAPTRPSSPNSPLVLVFGLTGGLVLGAGMALFREQRVTAVRSRRELQAITRAPVLGLIPWFTTGRRNLTRPPSSSAPAHALPMPVAFVAPKATRASEIAAMEAYARLFMNIQWAAPRGVRTVLITSPLPGDGKTTSAVQLAAAAARQGLRVLLIDADLRCGGLTTLLALRERPGFVDYLADNAPLATVIEPLALAGAVPADVIGAGSLSREAPSPHVVKGLRRLLGDATAYDLVLIDTPPINIVADAAALAPLVDAVLLVARSGETSPAAIELAMEQLHRAGAHVLGTILNGAEFQRNEGYGSIAQYRAYTMVRA
jgi:capsular exopolysaccharide synthesis family protein